MLDFNSHSHRLTSPAFWRPIKSDSSPLSLTEGMQKAGKEQCSGMLKSFMMESVNSANGPLLPCCLVRFISWRSRWQKVYWTLTVSPYKLFLPGEQYLCWDRAWLSVKFGSVLTLSVRSKEVILVKRLSPPLFAGNIPVYLISGLLFHIPSSNHNYIGKFYLLQGCWQPLRMKKYNLIICCCRHIFKHSRIRGQKTTGGL